MAADDESLLLPPRRRCDSAWDKDDDAAVGDREFEPLRPRAPSR